MRKPVPQDRQLSVTELGILKDRLTSARLDLATARLHARGCPEAEKIIDAAGMPLRAALDVIAKAYQRGKL
jgi:hypothetical protein